MDNDNIDINTTQNVLVSYEPAKIVERGLSWFLDMSVIAVYMGIVSFLSFYFWDKSDRDDDFNGTMAVVLYAFFSLPALLYSFLCEVFLNGQSIGKKAMNIKVVRMDGLQPTIGAYLLRWMLRMIEFYPLPVVATISAVSTQSAQRLGDLAAGTTVIKLTSRVSLYQTILYKMIPDYKITFQQVGKLSDKDISIIKEVYQYCRKYKNQKVLTALVSKVKNHLGITDSKLTEEEFIKTILGDYSQYEFER